MSDFRKKGKKREVPTFHDDSDSGGFRVAELLEKSSKTRLVDSLDEKGKQEFRERQAERRKKQASFSDRGGKNYQGGNKMYGRSLRPEDVRSLAVEKAAEKVVEAKAEGKGYKDAMKELNGHLDNQKSSNPRETFRTVFSLQRKLITKEIDPDVLFVVVKAIGMPQFGYTAVAVRNVRDALREKGVDLAKEGVTDRADVFSLEKLLKVLAANGLEGDRKYLADKMPNVWYQKIEARIARRLIIARRPDLAEEIPELSLDRKAKLTQEYVRRLLGGLKEVGAAHQFSVLAGLMREESWRVPIFPKKKVEAPSGKEKGTPKKKTELTTEKAVVDEIERLTPEQKKAALKDLEETKPAEKDAKVAGLVSPRAVKALEAAGFDTVSKAKKAGKEKLLALPDVGEKTVEKLLK